MQANRFKRWIELISATYFVHAVITNYRQASDGQLRPRMLSNRPPELKRDCPIKSNGQKEWKNAAAFSGSVPVVDDFQANAFTFPSFFFF